MNCLNRQLSGKLRKNWAAQPRFSIIWGDLLVSYVYHVQLEQAPQAQAEIAEMKWLDLDDADTLLAPLTSEIVMPWVKQYLASA